MFKKVIFLCMCTLVTCQVRIKNPKSTAENFSGPPLQFKLAYKFSKLTFQFQFHLEVSKLPNICHPSGGQISPPPSGGQISFPLRRPNICPPSDGQISALPQAAKYLLALRRPNICPPELAKYMPPLSRPNI